MNQNNIREILKVEKILEVKNWVNPEYDSKLKNQLVKIFDPKIDEALNRRLLKENVESYIISETSKVSDDFNSGFLIIDCSSFPAGELFEITLFYDGKILMKKNVETKKEIITRYKIPFKTKKFLKKGKNFVIVLRVLPTTNISANDSNSFITIFSIFVEIEKENQKKNQSIDRDVVELIDLRNEKVFLKNYWYENISTDEKSVNLNFRSNFILYKIFRTSDLLHKKRILYEMKFLNLTKSNETTNKWILYSGIIEKNLFDIAKSINDIITNSKIVEEFCFAEKNIKFSLDIENIEEVESDNFVVYVVFNSENAEFLKLYNMMIGVDD